MLSKKFKMLLLLSSFNLLEEIYFKSESVKFKNLAKSLSIPRQHKNLKHSLEFEKLWVFPEKSGKFETNCLQI